MGIAAMAATRRLHKELEDMRKSGLKSFRDIQVDEQNILTWHGLIVPENAPYNKGAFRIEINFPAEYPFKPPKIAFKTKFYHPNIDEKGQVSVINLLTNIFITFFTSIVGVPAYYQC